EHSHETTIPKEYVLVKGSVDELGDEPALRRRFVKVVKRQLPGFPVEPHQHRVVIIDRRRQPGSQLCELREGSGFVCLLGKIHSSHLFCGACLRGEENARLPRGHDNSHGHYSQPEMNVSSFHASLPFALVCRARCSSSGLHSKPEGSKDVSRRGVQSCRDAAAGNRRGRIHETRMEVSKDGQLPF